MDTEDAKHVEDTCRFKFFELTLKDYDYLVEQALLNDEYSKLLLMEIKGYTRIKMSQELHVELPTLDVMIKKLKKKIIKCL